MRLKQLKLAGFKSFVDPTSFDVPSQLVGVVGPNGCGKSNVMDAVRWVLGETRASELRGESMQDVIFNGSSERKPAARASVELIFDNSLGRIGGSWGQYAEISVKRVLTRDGQSSYLINNQTVRRKDVHDLFLGTGLGPRAYAIIGQGMISRIIEAKPEELRVFLEEAAGISKYKERRKETEARLVDTRENLSRVDDILRELTQQIEKLQRQAEVAERYKQLEAERVRLQRMIWIVKRDESQQQEKQIAEKTAAASLQLEQTLAQLRAIQSQEETLRSQSYAATDALQLSQQTFYERNAEVAGLEAQIRYAQDSRAQVVARKEALERQIEALTQQLALLSEQQITLTDSVENAQMNLEATEVAHAQAEQVLPELEQAVQQAQRAFDAARTRGAEISQGLQVSSARREAAQKQLQALQERAQRLAAQREQLGELDESQGELLAASLEQASEHEAMLDQRLAEVSHQSDLAQSNLGPLLASAQQAQSDLSDTTAKLEALQGLQASLEAQDKTQPWLESHGLQSLTPVSSKLQVQARAALAVEAALRDALHARRVERLDTVADLLQDTLPARVGFVAPATAGDQQVVEPMSCPPGLASLKSMAGSTDPAIEAALHSWLHGCFWASDLAEALAARAHLGAGARIFTAQGHAVDRHSVRSYAAEDARDGVLQRRSQIENLEKQSRAQRLLSEQARATAVQAQAQAAQMQEQTRALRDEHAQALRVLGDRRLAMEAFSQKVESARAARQRLQADEQEVEQASAALDQTIQVELERFDTLDAELAMHQEHAEQLRDGLLQAQQQLAQAAERLRASERAWRDAQFTVRELQTTQQRLDSDRLQREAALEQARSELEQVQTSLDESVDLGLREQLQQALEAQSQAQSELAQARARMEAAQADLRSALEERSRYEQAQEPVRALLQSLALEQQAARLAAEQYVLQLNETEFDEGALLSSFGEHRPRASQLQAELARSMQAIAALGAVNLAALDELAQVQERQEFLSAQAKDLNEAISTLEDAIRRIDRETRELLQSTYDTVNRQFGTLFPELFGGGEARLVLTGDEILDSGIQVMAHPPGKRNASIHLLSGGEKALTAIALVFALFELNPAPFCLLDEVDAPLDDANTERYCDMVRRMSDHTQFLFITHNKIAMELAQQLIGVTMQERGVSRIVAVDLEAASSFAQAA